VGRPSVFRVKEPLTYAGLTLSKDIVLELPVAIFHPATLPPPPPEPYPYPAPDAYMDPSSNPTASPTPLLHTPMPMLYPEPTQPPLYAYPMTPPVVPLPLAPAPLNGQLVIPPYTPHNGQLWFPPPPSAYIADPLYYHPPPLRPASANPSTVLAPIPSGLPVSGTPDHVLSSFSHRQQQQQQYPPQQPEQTIGHGALAARISHHLRVTSRARSVSPPPAPSQLHPPPPTQVEVELLSPKPMPSPKLVSETLSVDPFAQSFGKAGTRTRSLSVVKLEEMAARAAAETEAKAAAAAVDKTLPAPPVPSGKHGEHRRLGAQDIFVNIEEPELVPRTPSLSALSLLRPPQRHEQPMLSSYEKQEDSGLDALERRLVEQVGTRKQPPPPAMATTMADPPPAPVPAPVPVPGKGKGKVAPEAAEELGSAGAAVNESAISSLALGAEEDFGGRNVNNVLAALEGDDEDVEGECEGEDGRTQRLSKGAGASSGSERGTHKARSRKSAKSDSKDRGEKKAKKKREVREEEAARMKRAAKGRVAEWLEKLAEPEQDAKAEQQDTPSLPEPPTVDSTTPAPIESKPNPRSSGFISVATLRRAPISLQPPSAPTAAPNVTPMPAACRVASRYPPPPPSPPQVEMKYNVKSARGGRGGRVTAVASIWAEASKKAGGVKPAQPKTTAAVTTSTPKPQDARGFASRGRPPAKKEDSPPPPPRVPRAPFGLGVAAAATPSSPALSSSIARPVLSSTASLAHPPGARARARAPSPTAPPAAVPVSHSTPSPQPQTQPQPAATGWRAPLVSGAGLKADLAFGQARLRDLIRRYQGQAA
jgi:hypothetical protein